ncbi:anti-sigma factor [Flavobacterium litorale]|uniref:Anti-sigma factor n=1 Tax=Flavobacterium litorale TaxID=2856519 RepID=A0ABX8V4Q5_9FLAO|nr:anti-sigma factor [Flavobacterium litorale]QYJ67819.1 anti-sigma factor [Flavobacterium litorale]
MDSKELIESGTLELFVFGLLSENENSEIQKVAERDTEVQAEILAIEKSIINLSYGISPKLSAQNYNKLYAKLIKENQDSVVPINKRSKTTQYIGWAAAIILMFGIGIQYHKYNQVSKEVQETSIQRNKFEQMVVSIKKQHTLTERALAIVRDTDNTEIHLEGQQIAPESFAKVYLNKKSNKTHVDITGLPAPPEGKVYQVWALKLNPLTPISIGVLDSAIADANKGVYKVDSFEGAEAFGITLEPGGGSENPTLGQLHTLGKV